MIKDLSHSLNGDVVSFRELLLFFLHKVIDVVQHLIFEGLLAGFSDFVIFVFSSESLIVDLFLEKSVTKWLLMSQYLVGEELEGMLVI